MKNPRSGLTLIEILIAVSLLSLLTVGVLWSMRIGFNTLGKTDDFLIHNRRVANSRKIIENELTGSLVVQAALHPEPGQTQYVPFVQAEPQIMRFVTDYSLEDAWRGTLQLTTMRVIPGDQGKGVRLVMEEMPYTGQEQTGALVTGRETNPDTGISRLRFTSASITGRAFILADQLAACSFSYLERLTVPPFQIWRNDWVNGSSIPRAVRIDMTPLYPENTRLQVSSVTVALPASKTLGRYYSDVER